MLSFLHCNDSIVVFVVAVFVVFSIVVFVVVFVALLFVVFVSVVFVFFVVVVVAFQNRHMRNTVSPIWAQHGLYKNSPTSESSRRLWLSEIPCWKSFPANIRRCWKLFTDYPAARNAMAAKV